MSDRPVPLAPRTQRPRPPAFPPPSRFVKPQAKQHAMQRARSDTAPRSTVADYKGLQQNLGAQDGEEQTSEELTNEHVCSMSLGRSRRSPGPSPGGRRHGWLRPWRSAKPIEAMGRNSRTISRRCELAQTVAAGPARVASSCSSVSGGGGGGAQQRARQHEAGYQRLVAGLARGRRRLTRATATAASTRRGT